jgi:hypothetical protein
VVRHPDRCPLSIVFVRVRLDGHLAVDERKRRRRRPRAALEHVGVARPAGDSCCCVCGPGMNRSLLIIVRFANNTSLDLPPPTHSFTTGRDRQRGQVQVVAGSGQGWGKRSKVSRGSVTERALQTVQRRAERQLNGVCSPAKAGTDRSKPRRKFSVRQHAAILLNELRRLLVWRAQHGIAIDHDKWLFVVCHTLAPLKERNGGLDLHHLHDFKERCPHRPLSFDDDDAVAMIHKVCDYRAEHPDFRNLSSKTAGKLLAVTADERWRCRITQMKAIDDTPEQQQSLRREIDRQRKQRKRKAEGVQPRADYEAASLSQTKPWLAAGFKCRRTWERHRSRGTGPGTETVASVSATYLESRRAADTLATPSQPNRRSQVLEGVGGGVIGFAARPSSSRSGSCYGTAAKVEAEQASLAGFRFSTLGMGSSGTGIDPQIWPLISGSAKVEAEQVSLGSQWYNLHQRKRGIE